jgi:hypothetical protein
MTGLGGSNIVATTTNDGGAQHRGLWKGPAIVTALIVLVPLLRNLFVEGWNWDLRGFVFVACVGTLLFSAGLTCQMVIKKLGTAAYRVAVGVALAAAFLIFWGNWVQAADDVNPAALMFLIVPPLGLIGAAIARFQPAGMARAFFAAALAQVLVLVILLITRDPQVTPWSAAVLRGFGGNAFCALLFVGSALLFRRAQAAHA